MERTERDRLLQDVEAFCRALRPIEEQCYLQRRFNDRLVPLAREHGLLGMPVPVDHGGRGADMVTYARALARIGQEGTGVRTFFSGHSSIGQGPILAWGNDEQKRRLAAQCLCAGCGAAGVAVEMTLQSAAAFRLMASLPPEPRQRAAQA